MCVGLMRGEVCGEVCGLSLCGCCVRGKYSFFHPNTPRQLRILFAGLCVLRLLYQQKLI
jgi:hypothetical protein